MTVEESRQKQRERSLRWYHRNRDSVRATQHEYYLKTRHLKRRYGISPEQYDQLIDMADGKCPVCGIKFDRQNKLTKPHVDHCHKTGVVRGVLCGGCNQVEGFLKTPENALKMYKYMLKNELFYQGGS